MAYGYIQKKSNQVSGGSSSTIATGNTDAALTAGSVVYFCVGYNAASARTITLADGLGNTYVSDGNIRDTTTQIGIIWGHGVIDTGGIADLVATFSAAVSSRSIVLAEYSGIDTTTPFVTGETASQNQATPGTGTDGLSSTNITPGGQPAALIGLSFDIIAANTPSAGTGFTDRGSLWPFGGGAGYARLEDKRLTSTSAVAATFTAANNQRHLTAGIILREAAGGATIYTRRPMSSPVFQSRVIR